jgi:hypothetical protein
MIDPWTTLSAASAIVAFVEFGIVIIDKTIEMRNASSGAVKQVEALENMAARFQKDAMALKGSPTTVVVELSEDEERLNKLVFECKQLSDRILASVASLHAGKSASTRKTVMAAFRSERRKPELERYRSELKDKKSEITTVMLQVISMCS